ncbi:MAG: ABC transporter permease [Bacteroidia bacterium]|nr:ABC transporter permease [Bacteroidia bacterium]
MFKNNLKIAIRNLLQNRVYALISILGLAIGISGSTLITLYIGDELSYDNYHEKKDRIYRLTTISDFNGTMDVGVTNYAVGPTLKNDYPEVVDFVRFYGGRGEVELSFEDRKFKERHLWITDSSVFNVFTYDFIAGDPNTALVAPQSVVLTQSVASKLFLQEEALGKQVKMNNSLLTVTGVIKDPPANSEIPVKGFISITTMPPGFHQSFSQDWFRISFFTYLLFDKTINPDDFSPKLVEFEKKYVQPWAEVNNLTASHEYSLTPLMDVHFDNTHEYDLPKGNMSDIYIFSALALFLLIIAAINFVNLTLAQQARRAKEVGVRKTMGSSRKALIIQFLSESMVISLIAMVIGLALSELFIGQFNAISGKSVRSIDIFSPEILATEIGILLLIGLLGGSYPAFVLSSLKPVNVLKGGFSGNRNGGLFRKALILFQFVFSIFMISGTLLIADQMRYMRTVDLGFDRNNLISVDLPADTAQRRMLIPWAEELDNDSRIVAKSSSTMPINGGGEIMFRIEQNGEMVDRGVKVLFVDDRFIDVVGLDVLKGRGFSREYQTETTQAFIVNETATEMFGWGDDALNKRVQWNLMPNGAAANDGHVVGVVNDFNFMSLHNPLEPLILCYTRNGGRNLSVRLAKGDYTQTLKDMEASWKSTLEGVPFSFSFFDQDLNANYVKEENMFRIFTYFSSISILIACLGLFALLSYTIETRRKEISIRKVLGASTINLSWITVKDFIYLMGIAFILATPVDFYLMKNWQQGFAYKAGFNIWSYVLAIVITFVLSMLAVGYHSWKIARSNPINALRQE